MKDIYQDVTNQIIKQLESGCAPWAKAWHGASGIPFNGMTNKFYNGINILILWAKAIEVGYQSNNWMTYQQAKEKGYQVKKGEHGTSCVFYKKCVKENRETGEDSQYHLLKTFTVFNADQIQGVEIEQNKTVKLNYPQIQKLVERNNIKILEGKPAYHPGKDFISIPTISQFKATENYIKTLLHELIHWTGHETRLERETLKKYSSMRPQEELTAELGSAMLCAEFGIDGELRHAEYINSWLTEVNNDKKFIFKAAAAASQAAEYLKKGILAN